MFKKTSSFIRNWVLEFFLQQKIIFAILVKKMTNFFYSSIILYYVKLISTTF